MSDSIDALNKIVHHASKRGTKPTGTTDELSVILYNLLDKIVEVAGDALEDHVAARNRAKPRKERVYKEIVRRIAAYFCDGCDTAEGAAYIEEGVREVLASFDIETKDFQGNTVKIV